MWDNTDKDKKPVSYDEELPRMTLMEHLEELRRRIIFAVVSWILGSIAGWYLSNYVINFIKSNPYIKNINIIVIRPPEAFMVKMQLAMVLGLFIALPIIIIQATGFIVPALKSGERKWIYRVIPVSILLFYCGSAFAVFIMLPITLNFFLVQMTQGIAQPQISLEEYVNFIIAMVIMGGLVFQMPIILLFLTLVGVLSSQHLKKYRRYAILIIFIIAAVASPPDPFSQVVVAIPMLMLYELCIFFAVMAGK